MTETLQDTKPATYVGEPGDEDLFSHYAKKKDIDKAILEGTPCTALCGKTWIPTRDPEKFPVCPDCLKILNENFPEE